MKHKNVTRQEDEIWPSKTNLSSHISLIALVKFWLVNYLLSKKINNKLITHLLFDIIQEPYFTHQFES